MLIKIKFIQKQSHDQASIIIQMSVFHSIRKIPPKSIYNQKNQTKAMSILDLQPTTDNDPFLQPIRKSCCTLQTKPQQAFQADNPNQP